MRADLMRWKNTSGALALLVSLLATPLAAQSPPEVAREVGSYDRIIGDLENQFVKPAILASRYRTEARLNDARVAYFLGDFQRASVLFMDIVQRESSTFPSYRESVYLLGDSLYKLRNYQASRRFLKQLLAMGQGPYHDDAARLYLEMAYESRNFDGVDEIVSRLQGQGVDGALSYISGKTLYRQGKYPEARQAFARAAASIEYAVVADYFQGVVLVADKKYDEARTVFENVTRRTAATPRDIAVLELAYIALGRLAYERGDFEAAIDLYNRVPRESEHFDRALWEFTWVLVAKKMHREARRNVEILLLSDPDPTFIPEAKLLKADLSVMLDEYELAEDDFRDVLATFEPVKREMDEFAAKQQDLQAFFAVLVEDDLNASEPSSLPPLVAQWLESDPTIRSATNMIRDVRGVSGDIEDSMSVLREINARLQSSTRVQSFPDLAEGVVQGIEAENRLLTLRHALITDQAPKATGSMSAAEQQQWQVINQELLQIQTSYINAPQTRAQLAKREEAVFSEYDRLKAQLDAVAYQIDSQNAQLAAVDTYLDKEYGRNLTPAEKVRVDGLRADVRATLTELEKLRQTIQEELTLSRTQVGVGDAVVLAEADIRRRYRETMGRAEALLGNRGVGADTTTARAAIPVLEQRLDAYFARMNAIVDEKVNEIRAEVDGEERLLAEHRASLQELLYASEGGAGVLAYLNFMRTRAKFDELILRGDVGLIDVKWQKKERVTRRINQLFEDRTSELRMLQEAFNEVR